MNINLMNGNCLDKLKLLSNNSVDSIVTDPPYGLSFMGKKWDYDVPSTEIWQECLRVLKPGGHLLSFFGTRTYHRGAIRIEDAGFEIRDQIMWVYGSGFPKSHNIKEGDFKGWGTALKPANEPIVVARKPLEKNLTVAENVLKHGTGAINIDECRIATDEIIQSVKNQNITGGNFNADNSDRESLTTFTQHAQGRWPANIIFDEEAAQLLDAQSGIMKQGGAQRGSIIKSKGGGYGSDVGKVDKGVNVETDKYGASRFFYVAKASKSERNKGLDEMPLVESGIKNASGRGFNESEPYKKILNQNFHPTIKPIKLMQYLIKLVTPPNGTVIDPFMGSGSTGVAAKELGFNFIGIELSEEYFEIAKQRIKL